MNLQEKTLIKIKEWTLKYGELPLELETQISKLVVQYENQQQIIKQQPKISAGAKILREYQGTVYNVEVLEKGYRFNNKNYRSLSAIANEITGSHCNGRKFFGVM